LADLLAVAVTSFSSAVIEPESTRRTEEEPRTSPLS
jgi:hypothetical protein